MDWLLRAITHEYSGRLARNQSGRNIQIKQNIKIHNNGLNNNDENFENILKEINEDFSKNDKDFSNAKYPIFKSFRNFQDQVIGENRLQGLIISLINIYLKS